ncbi:hypothetical protein AB4Z39_16830 [Mycobacterium adipatum]|uniref:hypothetical protein n=1 Tax=Mycobacterium adipatum TaxID=1682113 RepID=UPI0034E08B5F
MLPDATTASPRMGGDLWTGEHAAAEFVRTIVEAADSTGRLPAILDAVRSHRVEDDFSSHWTYAREDFERKLYRKRAKVKVRFVELTDTIPSRAPRPRSSTAWYSTTSLPCSIRGSVKWSSCCAVARPS